MTDFLNREYRTNLPGKRREKSNKLGSSQRDKCNACRKRYETKLKEFKEEVNKLKEELASAGIHGTVKGAVPKGITAGTDHTEEQPDTDAV